MSNNMAYDHYISNTQILNSRLKEAAALLEQIDRALGLPEGGPVSPERTLKAIRKLKEN